MLWTKTTNYAAPHRNNIFHARNSCKLKTEDMKFAFQEEYQKEGIDWSFQDFVDNRPCLDLIEGRTSVFSLMNEVMKHFLRSKLSNILIWMQSYMSWQLMPEFQMNISFVRLQECRLKRELDAKSFNTRLETSLLQNSHFACPRFKSENHVFSIHHFAESVSYQVDGLVKKNKVRVC